MAGTKKISRVLGYLIILGLVVFLIFFFLSSASIGYGVKKQCRLAENQYGLECVDGLLATLDDANVDWERKNSAIWALGQLGDEKALPVLEGLYVEGADKKCDLGQEICHYSLYKAIKLLKGGANLTAPVWRD